MTPTATISSSHTALPQFLRWHALRRSTCSVTGARFLITPSVFRSINYEYQTALTDTAAQRVALEKEITSTTEAIDADGRDLRELEGRIQYITDRLKAIASDTRNFTEFGTRRT
jgi:hypothetical protein